jgi:hypothetical protein
MQLYKTAYSLLLSMLTLFAWSQDPARELININKSFYKNSDVAMQVTVRYFIDNADKPNKESKTEIYKNSSGYLHKTANYESMTNSDYRINIDHQKKVMVIARVNRPDAKTKKVDVDLFEKENFRLTLDTVMSYYKKVTVKNVDKNTNELLFTFKSGMYDYIRVSYDKTTYLVNGYYIKLNPAAMTDKKDAANHQYSYTITNKYLDKKTLSKKLFNEDNYVSINKQQITPSINYAGYRLVNNIK